MTITVVKSLLEAALAAINPAVVTAYENQVYKPVSGTPYQQLAWLFATPVNPSTSSSNTTMLVRESGILQVTLRYPQGVGRGDADARAELIRLAFPRGKVFTGANTTVIISPTVAIAPGRVDGDRWSVPVKIAFFANIYV